MKEKKVFNESFTDAQGVINEFIKNFSSLGEERIHQERNTIKVFPLHDGLINIKAFKVPNVINQIAYKFFRKSKAQRSFEYANILKEKGVGTPEPIGYYEYTSPLVFKSSYYISEQLESEFTFRELCRDLNYPDHEAILRGFTRFTFDLHEKQINFLDHSPGNTLIKKIGENYQYYLVDLNRMEFGPMNFETRMKNFGRLTTHKSMIEVMSDEYAKCSGESFDKIYTAMQGYTDTFQEHFHKKKRLKKKLKFWKK
ncbi:Kdo domain containing protein [Formosa sp. 4Alg 33]|uniref:Kdo domain containing protein n=1 Tax=Formosa sp. 4Alg 33 TaxID=3382189 RepID=UPI003D9C0C20